MKTYFFGYTEPRPSDSDVMVQNGLTHVTAWKEKLDTLGNSGGSMLVTSGGYDAINNGFNWIKGEAGSDDAAIILIFTHGTKRGLPVPKYTWEHIAAKVNEIMSRTVLIYLNACHSAYGVDAVRAKFGGKPKKGCNIGVFSAVGYDEEAQGGPKKGTPLPDEGENALLNHAILSDMRTFSNNVKTRWEAKRMVRTPKQWIGAADFSRPIW